MDSSLRLGGLGCQACRATIAPIQRRKMLAIQSVARLCPTPGSNQPPQSAGAEELAGFHDPSTPLETHVNSMELETRAVAPAVARISATLYPIRTWGYSIYPLNVIVLRRVPLSQYSLDPRTERPTDLLEPNQIAA